MCAGGTKNEELRSHGGSAHTGVCPCIDDDAKQSFALQRVWAWAGGVERGDCHVAPWCAMLMSVGHVRACDATLCGPHGAAHAMAHRAAWAANTSDAGAYDVTHHHAQNHAHRNGRRAGGRTPHYQRASGGWTQACRMCGRRRRDGTRRTSIIPRG